MEEVEDDEYEYRQLLSQAAESAVELIKRREERRVELFEEIRRIDGEIENLKLVISAGSVDESPITDDERPVLSVIFDLLRTGPMNVQQMHRTLLKLGHKVGTSSLYAMLAKAKHDGEFVSEKGIWNLSEKHRRAVYAPPPQIPPLPRPVIEVQRRTPRVKLEGQGE
jgi:hypothetical protein